MNSAHRYLHNHCSWNLFLHNFAWANVSIFLGVAWVNCVTYAKNINKCECSWNDNIWWESTTNIDGVNFKNKKGYLFTSQKKKKKIQNYMCVKCNYFKAVFDNM